MSESKKMLTKKGNVKISLFATAMVVAFFIILNLILTVYNNTFFKNTYVKCSYYGSTWRALANDIASLENEMIVPLTGSKKVSKKTSVMAKTINWETLQGNKDAIIDSKYNKNSDFPTLEEENYINNFYNAVIKYCSDRDINLSSEDKKIISSASEKAYGLYKKYLHLDNINKFFDFVDSSKPVMFSAGAVTVVLALLSIVKLYRKNQWKHRAVRFYIYIFASSGATLFLVPLILLAIGYLDTYSFTSNSLLAVFVAEYLGGILGYFIVSGAVLLIVTMVLIFYTYPKLYLKEDS